MKILLEEEALSFVGTVCATDDGIDDDGWEKVEAVGISMNINHSAGIRNRRIFMEIILDNEGL